MRDRRRRLGDAGEQVAVRTLEARGWQVLERNARTRYGEIDLVCHDGTGYVFVEVKTRRPTSFVPAVEAVGPRKMDRLIHLAQAWLALHRARAAGWRLAVLAVTLGGGADQARLIDVCE